MGGAQDIHRSRLDPAAVDPKAFAYIRVSKERDDMISPEIQRDEISRYCVRKGWEVSEWFQDLDLSGRAWDRKKRKGLDDLMDRALAGECDAVVFYRITVA
jgi:DNA invertase Pin-like site-specific DNA recombinase